MKGIFASVFLAVAFAGNCTNIGLLDKLENPGSSTNERFATNYYVFVSSWTTLGAMAGSPFSECNSIIGPGRADCACTRAAIGRGLRRSGSHVFRAWLSVDATPGPDAQDAICRVQGQGNGCATNHPSIWFNTVGQSVVGNFGSFTGATLTNAIRYDEFGIDQGLNDVWTGTVLGGTAVLGADCNDWTDQGAATGRVGDRIANNNLWTDNGNNTCDNSYRIYCVASPQF